jgi:hypothetical protein
MASAGFVGRPRGQPGAGVFLPERVLCFSNRQGSRVEGLQPLHPRERQTGRKAGAQSQGPADAVSDGSLVAERVTIPNRFEKRRRGSFQPFGIRRVNRRPAPV